ncbi:hypothetical protein ACP4OV_020766 [Aristida adscensionis]
MARGAQPSGSLLVFSLGLVLIYFASGSGGIRVASGQKTWCVAKPSASNEILALNLNYACSQVSCAVIQKGGPCYYPDNLVSRAAVAMNLYYAANGRHAWNCFFNNSALVVQSDPITALAPTTDPIGSVDVSSEVVDAVPIAWMAGCSREKERELRCSGYYVCRFY